MASRPGASRPLTRLQTLSRTLRSLPSGGALHSGDCVMKLGAMGLLLLITLCLLTDIIDALLLPACISLLGRLAPDISVPSSVTLCRHHAKHEACYLRGATKGRNAMVYRSNQRRQLPVYQTARLQLARKTTGTNTNARGSYSRSL